MSKQNIDNIKNKNSTLSVMTFKDLELDLNKKPEPLSKKCFAVSIRSLLQNWRQGTVGCKTRAEVAYSNKKPWKQKGTGRARAGSRRSPIWVGGGIIFGPQPRTRKLKLNRELKRSIINNMIWSLIENNKVMTLDFNVPEKPKTSQAFKVLKDNKLHDKKFIFLVDPMDFHTQASFGNLPNIKMLLFDEINSYDLAFGNNLVFLKKDLNLFKEMVLKWI